MEPELSAGVARDAGRERVDMRRSWNQSPRRREVEGGTKIDPHTPAYSYTPAVLKPFTINSEAFNERSVLRPYNLTLNVSLSRTPKVIQRLRHHLFLAVHQTF